MIKKPLRLREAVFSSFVDKIARQKGPDGPFFIGEESLKTGGKDFHRVAPFVEGQ